MIEHSPIILASEEKATTTTITTTGIAVTLTFFDTVHDGVSPDVILCG